MRRFAVFAVVLAMFVAACGDAAEDTSAATEPSDSATTVPDETTDTGDPSQTTVPDETTDTGDPSQTTVPDDAPTTTQAPAGNMTPCQEVWPEDFVKSVAGDAFSFFDANIDDSACTFVAGSDSLTVFFRAGDSAALSAAQDGAALTGTVVPLDICEASYSIEIQDTITIVEGLSSGTIYNATLGGVANALGVATALVESAC